MRLSHPAVLIPLIALVAGAVVGFLVAREHHVSDPAMFAGLWMGAGGAVFLLALIPAALVVAILAAVAGSQRPKVQHDESPSD